MTLQNYAFTVVNAKASPRRVVVFEELHFANAEFFFFRAFPSLVAIRTKQQVVKCCPPTDVGRAIFDAFGVCGIASAMKTSKLVFVAFGSHAV